jgi:tripartite-type tricarboxylate transporter receptor subunit TctC
MRVTREFADHLLEGLRKELDKAVENRKHAETQVTRGTKSVSLPDEEFERQVEDGSFLFSVHIEADKE